MVLYLTSESGSERVYIPYIIRSDLARMTKKKKHADHRPRGEPCRLLGRAAFGWSVCFFFGFGVVVGAIVTVPVYAAIVLSAL